MATDGQQQQPTSDLSTVLGMRRSALGEVLVFFAAALLFDALVLDGTRFSSVQPHPFWLLVLLISAHYGTAAGVFAAVLGSLLAFAGNLPPRDPLENQSVYLLSVLAQPVLWFASAVVLGELRTRQVRRNDELQAETALTAERAERLRAANAALESSNERLQTRAAGRVKTAVSLVEAGRTIETRESSSVFASVEGLITSLLSPTAYSIYLSSPDGLKLVVHTTDGKTPEAERHFASDSAIYRAVIDHKKVLHVATPEGQEILAEHGVLAGPLLDVKGGKALGMLKIEALPLANLQEETVQAFASLCEWIGGAYRSAQEFEAANRSSVFHSSQLFTDAYYQPMSAFIIALGERARFPVTQLTVRMQPMTSQVEADMEAVSQTIRQAVEAGLRNTDLAFDLRRVQGEYAVVLPMTPLSKGQVVADRLRHAIENSLREHGQSARMSITFEALYVPTAQDLKPWHRAIIRRTDPYWN